MAWSGFAPRPSAICRWAQRVHARFVASWSGVRIEGCLGQADGEQPGVDAEDAYSVATGLDGQVLGELDGGRFGDRVGRNDGPAERAGLAGDVDDASSASLDHRGKGGAGVDEGAQQVDF